jgi:adenylyltransferase/sulfurtransferase
MTSFCDGAEITVLELKNQLDTGLNALLLDVREAHELNICSLKNDFHIPLGDLADRIQELMDHKEKTIIVYCRSGRRSQIATNYLRANGFSSAFNLQGGILAWADNIDNKITKY